MATSAFLRVARGTVVSLWRWGVVALVAGGTWVFLFGQKGGGGTGNVLLPLVLAAIFGAYSVASRHENMILNAAYQILLAGALGYFASVPMAQPLRVGDAWLATGACLVYVGLVCVLLRFPVIIGSQTLVEANKELVSRTYMATLAAIIVAVAVGGGLPYAAFSTHRAAAIGWNAYGYALFFVAAFSGTLAVLLVLPIREAPRLIWDSRAKLSVIAVPIFLVWAVYVGYRDHGDFAPLALFLVAFAGTCSALFRALQRVL